MNTARMRRRTAVRPGFALVVVLIFLVLLASLAVGLLMRSSTERAAASGYRASVTAQLLSETVIGLAEGQINQATSQGTDTVWTSQPGMVRTYDSAGTLKHVYKLYSAKDMIATASGITNGKSEDEASPDWAASPALWTDLNAPIESGGTKHFPILAPHAAAAGYAITAAPGATDYQSVPMPVRWLYVLEDGSIVLPTGDGDVATVAGASDDNPIVGRIAFWADDESAKININTASEGTFWDVPRVDTDQDHAFGEFQPAQREYQRYPGHPAMTSLSTVFAHSGTAPTTDQIYAIAPRIVGEGSSKGGTELASQALTPDDDRLYTSIDELVFNPTRGPNAPLSREQLEAAKFFLTAHSRAPETNLFNLPRISVWPEYRDLPENRTTPFDRLIALCASTGPTGDLDAYYFQREKHDSPTHDILIPRNEQLYQYLQYLTSQPVPGFGGNFLTKYTDDRDQILTEIFDYIRSTNLHDDLLPAGAQYTTYWPSKMQNVSDLPTGHGWVAPIHYKPAGGKMTMGFGRSYTISELALGFICNASGDYSNSNNPASNPVLDGIALNPGEIYIQPIIVPELFSPMLGNVPLCPDITIEISGLNNLKITSPVSEPLFPIASGLTTCTKPWPNVNSVRIYGGNPNWRLPLYGKGAPARGSFPGDVISTDIEELYPFIGNPIKLPTGTTHFTLNGALLEIKIYAGSTPSLATLLQTLTIEYPGATIPVPKIVNTPITKGNVTATEDKWWTFVANYTPANPSNKSGRFAHVTQDAGGPGKFFLGDFDVVQSMIPPHGDFRLAAATYDAPKSYYEQHPLFETNRIASTLWGPNAGTDDAFKGGGKYIASLNYGLKYAPDIPSSASGMDTPEVTGDYDNAMGKALDGPYVNKPDEGATVRVPGRIPYFDDSGADLVGGPTFFSPNRQIPSPGMFGSLPSGIKAGVPWQTLLFRPQAGHVGSNSPKDHLLLDLFWMPVVEPYAISDRFSTAGKINMNYQIVPFTYIERSTGIRALMESEKVTGIPNTMVNTYKGKWNGSEKNNYRFPIDQDETLRQFKTRFDSGDVFRSASEICDIHIVPDSGESPEPTVASMPAYWSTHALTGDNSRERIYTTLYPRLTTRSNTFTVHFRVQSLRQTPSSTPGTWTEDRDIITGEYRGSAIIERFIDASNPDIPDYAATPADIPNLDALDTFYRWRVVENRQFAP